MSEELSYKIAKLEARPGDVVVFKFDRVLSSEQVRHFQLALKPVLPDGVKAMILDLQVELSLLTAAEIEQRSVGRETP